MRFGESVSPRAGLAGKWVILPVGSCEAHGPHLPLDTDVRLAEEMALRAAAKLENAVVLPPLPYGVTRFARNFAGTLSVPAEVVVATVTEVLCAALAVGARGAAVANAHLEPEHVDALFAACAKVRERTSRPVAFPNVGSKRHAERIGRVAPLDGHAGIYETSMMLALAPWLVDEPVRASLPPVTASLAAGIGRGAESFEEAGGLLAYFGTPARATAELGDALLDELAAILVEEIRAAVPSRR